jgi:hypothetical protein
MSRGQKGILEEARSFNAKGLQRFQEWLSVCERNGRAATHLPIDYLTDPALTVPAEFSFKAQAFDSKYEMGRFLLDCMGASAERRLRDDGLWPWLSLALNESTMPVNKGARVIGHESRHIIKRLQHRPSQSQSHRHLVFASVFNVMRFGEHARVLMQKPHQQARIEEDVMSRRTSARGAPLASCYGCVVLLNKLYGDKSPKKGRKKSMARGRGLGGGPGEFLRFLRFIDQVDQTYDIVSMTCEQLAAILPQEFAERYGA